MVVRLLSLFFLALAANCLSVVDAHGNIRGSSNSKGKVIHFALMSNRIKPSLVVMSSVCSTTSLPNDSLFFHYFVDDSQKEEVEKACTNLEACKGAKISVTSISTATQQLHGRNFDPFWAKQPTSGQGSDETKWGVVTPYVDEKHGAPLNLLRFYLPHLPEFDDIKNIIFLDDDIVVQKDISKLASLDHHKDTAILAGCQHWQWKDGAGFQNTYNLSVRDSNYVGNLGTVCNKRDYHDPAANCVADTLEQDISDLAIEIEGEKKSSISSHPLDRQAFNMGLNVIGTDTWVKLGITNRFEKLIAGNFAKHLFPSDTLAFGLVLGYFAVGDSFECYDDEISHFVGLAFIPEDVLKKSGYTVERLEKEAFALHYNGPLKPWELEYNHICAAPSATLTRSADIWLRHCIELNVCTCTHGPEQHEGKLDEDSTATETEAETRGVGTKREQEGRLDAGSLETKTEAHKLDTKSGFLQGVRQLFNAYCPPVAKRGRRLDDEGDICAGGDPHFKTWNGTWYSYHGQCDLVMLQDHSFQKGLGLDVHIRTKIRYDYSFIESAAIRIGSDVLEVSSWGDYFFNGVASAGLPGTMASDLYTVSHQVVSEKQHLFEIFEKDDVNKEAIATISTFKDWVTVKFNLDLPESEGLFGSPHTGTLFGRDGETIFNDVNAFGAEWQVHSDEPMLFQTSRAPQHPNKCIFPSPKSADSRRLGASVSPEAAAKACNHWDEGMKELCVVDVMASGDIEMAQGGGY